jgi:F0F1-type ATP synthase assembly protein I
MFPHGDRGFGHRAKHGRAARAYTLMVVADVVAALALMYGAILTGRFDKPLHAFLGALAGVLPDVVVGLTEYAQVIKKSARMYFRRFYRFHTFNHNRVITFYDFGMKFGLVYQVIVLLLILKLW